MRAFSEKKNRNFLGLAFNGYILWVLIFNDQLLMHRVPLGTWMKLLFSVLCFNHLQLRLAPLLVSGQTKFHGEFAGSWNDQLVSWSNHKTFFFALSYWRKIYEIWFQGQSSSLQTSDCIISNAPLSRDFTCKFSETQLAKTWLVIFFIAF